MDKTDEQYVSFKINNGIVIFEYSCIAPNNTEDQWMFLSDFKKPYPNYPSELSATRNPVLEGRGILTHFQFFNTPYIIKDARLREVIDHFENNNLFILMNNKKLPVEHLEHLGSTYAVIHKDEVIPIDLDTVYLDSDTAQLIIHED